MRAFPSISITVKENNGKVHHHFSPGEVTDYYKPEELKEVVISSGHQIVIVNPVEFFNQFAPRQKPVFVQAI